MSILAIFTITSHQSTTVYPRHACLEVQHWKGSGLEVLRSVAFTLKINIITTIYAGIPCELVYCPALAACTHS